MTEITEVLRTFVRKHVRTVGELEVLLWFFQNPQQTWTPEQIARELRGNVIAAADYLAHFERAGLLRERDAKHYQYVQNPTTHDVVRTLADTYAERPVSVVDLIYSEPRDQIQLLADAFKIKKKD